MSDATPDPSLNGDKKSAETPREPTEIVVFRGDAQPGSAEQGAAAGGASGGGASANWQDVPRIDGPRIDGPRLEIPYYPEHTKKTLNMRMVGIAAAVALIGAVGGALATTSVSRLMSNDKAAQAQAAATADQLKAAQLAVTQLETQVASLKADADKADKAAKARNTQLGKVTERLEKAEKAHEETSTRLAKLTEAQDKERRAEQAAQATGSIPNPPRSAGRDNDPNRALAGWQLNRIVPGGAEVEEAGVRYVVYPGDPLPGLGAVSGLRRIENGRWAVVTSKGLILSR